jgi:hypothetical protein
MGEEHATDTYASCQSMIDDTLLSRSSVEGEESTEATREPTQTTCVEKEKLTRS